MWLPLSKGSDQVGCSTLPWTAFYVADPAEQFFQNYEEISFLIGDVSRIGKGVLYETVRHAGAMI